MTGIPFCGDIHDKAASVRPVVERRLERTGADTLVLLGDLLNDWWMTAPEETAAFAAMAEAIDAWRAAGVTVHVLPGNHDLIYMMPQDSPEAHRMRACSPGYLPGAHRAVHDLLRALDPRIAFGLTLPGGVPLLCTHAGLTAGWIRWSARVPGTPVPADAPSIAAWLDEGFAARPMAFAERVGTARGGGHRTGISPVWADRGELVADPAPGIVQVVGHTPVRTVTRHGGDLWFCDTMSTLRTGAPIGDGSMLHLDIGSGRFTAITAESTPLP